MDKYYVIVTGNGITSRANLEALMEDYFYANGENGVLVLPYKDKPSQGQIFAAQLVKDKGRVTVIYTKSGNFGALPPGTVVDDIEPMEGVIRDFSKEKTAAFLLWDDEDTESNNSLVEFSASGIECFDLTDGLIKISKSSDAKKIEEPKMPEKEQTSKDEETPKAEEDEEDEEYEDEDEEEDADVMENLYYGIRAMAQIFAEAFVEALGDAPIKPSKGPKE